MDGTASLLLPPRGPTLHSPSSACPGPLLTQPVSDGSNGTKQTLWALLTLGAVLTARTSVCYTPSPQGSEGTTRASHSRTGPTR